MFGVMVIYVRLHFQEDLYVDPGGLSWICRMAATTLQKNVKEDPKAVKLLPLVICAIALPLSMIMWIGNLAFSFFTGGAHVIYHEGKYAFVYLFLLFKFFGIFTVLYAL
jgi:hypothetical protein